jgi:hypothetical protein
MYEIQKESDMAIENLSSTEKQISFIKFSEFIVKADFSLKEFIIVELSLETKGK